MRTQLAKLGSDSRFTFRGEFERYGYKRASDRSGNEHYSPTLLLTDLQVLANGDWKAVTDHLWFNLTKGFQKLGLLSKSDTVQLNGRVNDYYKGYFTQARQHDIKLSYPSKIELVNERDLIPLPKEKNAVIGLIMNLEWDFYTSTGRPIDDYYLKEFKNCPECEKYDYGVEVHTQAPSGWDFVPTYDYDDYEVDDDFDEDDDDWALEMARCEKVKQQNHDRRVKRGQNWLSNHQDLVGQLKEIMKNQNTGKKAKDRLIRQLIEPAVEIDETDPRPKEQQIGQVKNDIKLYLASIG